ncbi:YciI family protein [Microlunatus speluncae]|uniref:YciI family protein n=1 Tax=Microlunatus speluncae TaxID=2594267 RepID=UPI0012663BD5|nr:YciI family protein [Microlunatus speluncae]
MKYLIMLYGSQRDYDVLTGKGEAAWTAEDVSALHEFMGAWNNALVESGEFVDANGLSAPVHARRISMRDGGPVITDGPYAETQEVLAGYTIVDCVSFDRATEIAAQLANTPHPPGAAAEVYVDIRPIDDAPPTPDL